MKVNLKKPILANSNCSQAHKCLIPQTSIKWKPPQKKQAYMICLGHFVWSKMNEIFELLWFTDTKTAFLCLSLRNGWMRYTLCINFAPSEDEENIFVSPNFFKTMFSVSTQIEKRWGISPCTAAGQLSSLYSSSHTYPAIYKKSGLIS